MNFPPPVNEQPFSNISLINGEESTIIAGKQIRREVLGDIVEGEGIIVDVAVSVDGSWPKRYGFNSLLGMVFVISIDTGAVLDFCVKSLVCHVCKHASEAWKKEHEKTCMINHDGSSGAMEKEDVFKVDRKAQFASHQICR